jgi:hypothetical protein
VVTDYPERKNTIEEAESVFEDPYFTEVADRVSARGEQEYHGVGLSNQNRLRFVAFTIRNDEIRVFSCRNASIRERQTYEKEKQSSGDGR